MRHTSAYILFQWAGLLSFFLCFHSCRPGDKIEREAGLHHNIEIRKQGMGMIYIDKVPENLILQSIDSTSGSTFFSWKIGFVDSSAATDAKPDLEKGKYFQYDMYKDWKAIKDGDTIAPVFFQPLFKKEKQIDEGVIVFEMSGDVLPDTLIYNDSFGFWNTQVIALTGK